MNEKQKIIKKSLRLIKQENLFFLSDLKVALKISQKLFDELELGACEEILNGLDMQKMSLKKILREKWLESSCATLQIALYRLVATPQERRYLSSSYQALEKEEAKTANLSDFAMNLKKFQLVSEGENDV